MTDFSNDGNLDSLMEDDATSETNETRYSASRLPKISPFHHQITYFENVILIFVQDKSGLLFVFEILVLTKFLSMSQRSVHHSEMDNVYQCTYKVSWWSCNHQYLTSICIFLCRVKRPFLARVPSLARFFR